MIIIGHKLIKHEKFIFIKNEIKKDFINCFYYDEKLIEKMIKEEIKFAIIIKNENELILSNAFNADFILIENDLKLAKISAKIAEFYMFDSKVLLINEDLSNLNQIYDLKLDGIILKNAIKNF